MLIESDIEGPVEIVLDGPVASHGVSEGFGREGARGDVGSLFGCDLVTTLDLAFDHSDGGDLRETGSAGIRTLGGDPVDNVGHGVGSDLEPAVLLANALEALDFA